MDMESLNHRVSVKAMAKNGMSQREIAAALGISQPSVSRLLAMTDLDAGDPIAQLRAKMRAVDARIVPPSNVLHGYCNGKLFHFEAPSPDDFPSDDEYKVAFMNASYNDRVYDD